MRRFESVVRLVKQRIESGTLKVGEKLPSIRRMCEITGFSISTVQHAYAVLESDGIIESRPRSGYLVVRAVNQPQDFSDGPDMSDGLPTDVSVKELILSVTSLGRRHDVEAFGAINPSRDLFQREKLDYQLRQILRRKTVGTPDFDDPEGDPLLRKTIARRLSNRAILVRPKDVLIVWPGLAGLDICLEAVTKPGDTVIVETPSFFPIFASLERRQLQAVEIYSHPKNGVSADQFRYLLSNNNVSACILMPNCHYPTGVSYSAETMKHITNIAYELGTTIIELDIFGDLSFDGIEYSTLKKYDGSDTVIYLSSFSHLSQFGYGFSAVVNLKHRDQISQNYLLRNPFAGQGAIQRALAEYLLKAGYERQLRKTSHVLEERVLRGLELIGEHFPSSCAISRPHGGFMCWVRGPQGINTVDLSRTLAKNKIGLPPGPIFSLTGSFTNFFGLNLSFEWTAQRIDQIKTIGRLLTSSNAIR